MKTETVTSAQNPKIKELLALQEKAKASGIASGRVSM